MTGGPVVVITHVRDADTGWVDAVIDRGRPRRLVRPFLGEELPDPADCGAVVCFGGPQAAYELERFPFLHHEQEFLRSAVAADVPVLGICLGSQLLAAALGGRAVPGDSGLEHGFIDVRAADGAEHPLLPLLPGRWLSFHSDTLVPPPGATVLAVSDRYAQAWARGPALGLQFHPELSAAGVRVLVEKERDKLARFGVDGDGLVEETGARESDSRARCERLIGQWLALAAARRPIEAIAGTRSSTSTPRTPTTPSTP